MIFCFSSPMFGNSDSIYGYTSDSEKQISGAPAIDMSLKTLYLHSLHHK